MPRYAWFSKRSANRDGTATYTRPDGSEVEVSFVADGPDELAADPGKGIDIVSFPDLVFVGEVVRCVRLAGELDFDPPSFDPPSSPNDYVDPGDFE